MPVLPLVGSINTVSPGLILPSFSAASIIARPMRSFTLLIGFWLSSFRTIFPGRPLAMRFSRTSGVLPISPVTSSAIRIANTSSSKVRWNEFRASCDFSGIGRGFEPLSRSFDHYWKIESHAETPRRKYQTGTIDIETWRNPRPAGLAVASRSQMNSEVVKLSWGLRDGKFCASFKAEPEPQPAVVSGGTSLSADSRSALYLVENPRTSHPLSQPYRRAGDEPRHMGGSHRHGGDYRRRVFAGCSIPRRGRPTESPLLALLALSLGSS